MQLSKEQIQSVIHQSKEQKYIINEDSAKARKEHQCKTPSIMEIYADTWTKCGDARTEVFGLCRGCKEQIYHYQRIKAIDSIFGTDWVDE